MSLVVSEVSEGIHRLFSLYTNWYLVAQGDRLTVLDAGFPGDWAAFCSSLEQLGYSPAQIDAVVISHHHPDHAGNAERLRQHGAAVYCHELDAPYLRGERRLWVRAHIKYLVDAWYAVYMLRLVAKGGAHVARVQELTPMSDGEVLDVPGSPRVVHVPGHTAGSCALWLEDRSILFSGDSIVTTDVTRGRRKGPQIIDGPVTEDAALAAESLSLLAATKAKTVLPGHGEPWRDGIENAVEIARSQL